MTRDNTRHFIRTGSIVVISIIVLGYAVFAFRDIIRGPSIEISEPISGTSYATSTVIVKGVVKRIQNISMNDRPIFIDQSGNFAEIILLQPGYNTMMIKGVDKFGRKEQKLIELMRIK